MEPMQEIREEGGPKTERKLPEGEKTLFDN